MTRSVVLIGGMGAGKSTVGKALAERLGYELVDTDEMVERATGRSVAEIWTAEGEQGFRSHEHDAVVRACARPGRVIASGGGAVLQLTNYGLLKGAGTIVYLRAPAEMLWERTRGSGGRPLATDRASFMKMSAERAPAYESAADITVDVEGRAPEDVAAEIEGLLP